jgi:hypothetical protein
MTRGKFLGKKAIFCLWPGLSLVRGFAKKPHKTITSCLSGASLEKIGSRFRHANFFSESPRRSIGSRTRRLLSPESSAHDVTDNARSTS